MSICLTLTAHNADSFRNYKSLVVRLWRKIREQLGNTDSSLRTSLPSEVYAVTLRNKANVASKDIFTESEPA